MRQRRVLLSIGAGAIVEAMAEVKACARNLLIKCGDCVILPIERDYESKTNLHGIQHKKEKNHRKKNE